MDSLKWFEELLSKTNDSEFDKQKIPGAARVGVWALRRAHKK